MSFRKIGSILPIIAVITACSGGGSSDDSQGVGPQATACSGSCADTPTSLTAADVQTVIAQAVQEAQSQGQDATIAVVDRVGNVLGVYRMGDAAQRTVLLATQINGPLDINGNATTVIDSGLEGVKLPTANTPANIDDQAAITKAVTGAYLSSEGNAFSTRTANHIVQQNFNPQETTQPSGPLFGVQFSQFSCSDFTNDAGVVTVGPKRSPLGMAADPGGLPLYKNGTPVGGIGVIADGLYSLDRVITDNDRDMDEMIAFAGTFSYAAPVDRRADRITVDGKTLRFSDVGFGDLMSDPQQATPFASIPAGVGTLIPVTGYTDGTVKAGVAFGQPASGIRPDTLDFPGLDAFVFVDAANNERFRPKASTDASGAPLTANEVQTLLQQALTVANRSRAQIRRPTGSQARVTIAVVDTVGEILGMVRTRDAPIFGSDVSIQKARTAALFSSTTAATFLSGLPDAKYLNIPENAAPNQKTAIPMGGYVTALQNFVDPAALTNGIAFSDRAGGNLSRPFFPDGTPSPTNGPLSKVQGSWSIFSTGLQLDMVINAVFQHVLSTATGGAITDVTDNCAAVDFNVGGLTFTANAVDKRMANGPQIFPGSVPIYRGNVLVGGIGISGDGVDQDDMIAFLGLDGASTALNGAINNAPINMRADTLSPQGTNLRYVQCPQGPFIDSNASNVCMDK
jgi:uncharacterized protein GlcG (DUF336 family)